MLTAPHPKWEMSPNLYNAFIKYKQCFEQMEDLILAAMCSGIPSSHIVITYPRFNSDMTTVEGQVGFKPL